LLGKNATLTGRVPLWHSLLGSIARRPLLGYGYGTFWLNTNPEMIRIWLLNPWQPPDAHDAYLELALSLGIVGASIATLLLVVVTARALSLCRQPHARWAIYVATYLIVYIVTNVDETQIFRGGDLNCFLLAFCYFTVLRAIHGEDVSAAEDRTDRGKEKSSGSRLSQSGRDHPAGRRASPFT
jgi:exopolysaccharide production protein ExoQ